MKMRQISEDGYSAQEPVRDGADRRFNQPCIGKSEISALLRDCEDMTQNMTSSLRCTAIQVETGELSAQAVGFNSPDQQERRDCNQGSRKSISR